MKTAWKQEFVQFMEAIVRAEGGHDAFLRAVRCSLPATPTFEEAMRVGVNTVQHVLWDYAMAHRDEFIDLLAARWAPVGAANDPKNLNANWAANVKALFKKRLK